MIKNRLIQKWNTNQYHRFCIKTSFSRCIILNIIIMLKCQLERSGWYCLVMKKKKCLPCPPRSLAKQKSRSSETNHRGQSRRSRVLRRVAKWKKLWSYLIWTADNCGVTYARAFLSYRYVTRLLLPPRSFS